jgi:hypothetical protein
VPHGALPREQQTRRGRKTGAAFVAVKNGKKLKRPFVVGIWGPQSNKFGLLNFWEIVDKDRKINVLKTIADWSVAMQAC